MQVTTNVVRLPSIVVDAYLDILKQSITPILSEENLPSKSQAKMLEMAQYAAQKSVCMKFMKELETAGLFEGVVSIDFPGFKWTRGAKFCYAVDCITPCLVKTMALEMVEGRDISEYLDFLEAWDALRVDSSASELLSDVEGPAARRLEDHILGLTRVNATLMVGETPTVIMRLLSNVKTGLDNKVDTPLDMLDQDMELLMHNVVTYL